MKKIIFNILFTSSLVVTSGNALFAGSLTTTADTIRKPLLASLDRKHEGIVLIKEANVIYPEIFEGNETESIDYVEKFCSKRKDYIINTFKRSKVLFPKAEAILKKYDIPGEFKVLLALESGFNPNAVSTAGAVGYWQIMDEAAKEYGLKIPQKIKVADNTRSKHKVKKVNFKVTGVDERKNFIKSTYAAARYLKDRSKNLDNDWLLIAASYNCGVGNVWSAMERCGKTSPTFWDIKNYLPAETRTYVMNFIALNVIFNNIESFQNNTLCFKDIISNVEELNEQLSEPIPAPITE